MTVVGGHTDFLDPELSHLVDYELVPCAANFVEGFFTSEQSWAAADHQSAVDALRDVHESRADAFARARVLQSRVRDRYSAERLAPRWIEAIEACLAACWRVRLPLPPAPTSSPPAALVRPPSAAPPSARISTR